MERIATPFQSDDAKFLLNRGHLASRGGYLATDPGTGKTVTTCKAIKDGNLKTGLIIPPANINIKLAWRQHLIDWAGIDPDEIQIITAGKDLITNKPWTIANYELLIKDSAIYRQLYWGKYDVIVVDEAKRLRNMDSKTSKSLFGRKGDCLLSRGYYKWLLDGTPAPNRILELYPPLRTLAPELIAPYDTYASFGQHFCAGFYDGSEWNFKGASNTDELYERIKPFMRIRRIEDVWDEIPDVLESTVFMDIGTIHVDNQIIDLTNSYLPSVRKAVGTCKIPYALDYISGLLGGNDRLRVVIFTFSKNVSEQLSSQLGFPLIYGGSTPTARAAALEAFITGRSQGLVAQIGTAGQGLDGLQNICDNMIVVEPDWSPGGHDQLIGRLLRYGQESDIVRVTNLVALGTVDEKVIGCRWNKAKVLDKVFVTNVEDDTEMATIEDKLDTVIALLTQIAGGETAAPKKNGGKKAATAEAETTAAIQNTVAQPQAPATGAVPVQPPAAAFVAPPIAPPTSPSLPAITFDDVLKAALSALNCLGEVGVTEDRRAQMNQITRSLGGNELNDFRNMPQVWAQAKVAYELYEQQSRAAAQPAAAATFAGI